VVAAGTALGVVVVSAAPPIPANGALIARLASVHGLENEQIQRLSELFSRSPYIGTGNPEVTVHPMTEIECRARRQAAGVGRDAVAERICGGPYMRPLYDPATQTEDDATSCIDEFEFPDMPCEYPVVWVRASEAADICVAMGKRLCDAHEWEGGCEGELEDPDYRFDLAAGLPPMAAVARMRAAHNASAKHSWSYGPRYREGVCATGSFKTAACNGGGWEGCGSNTYPTGSFPECQSALGVYDLNGNAAEHMNLPLSTKQLSTGTLSSEGSQHLGVTEMKGSWFIFDAYRAHEDWCRWRAPYWHGSYVRDPESHRNYHLGFRCCKSL
jgi:formylglycine-generating enzyme required for sulfatase activity